LDKLVAMRAFVEIVDRGSLTAAAQALGKSQPTMVRTLSNLESVLGARLLRRTTRRLALTEEGRGYLAQCRRILADIEDAERSIASGDAEPRGDLRITAPVTFGHRHVAPITVAFLKQYPKVRVELLLLDRVVNLLEEGVDLAVRIGLLADSSMVAIRIGSMRRVLVVSPAFLKQHGHPAHPKAIAGCSCVQFRGLGTGGAWCFWDETRPIRVRLRAVFATNHALTAVEACAQGMGYGLFLDYQVAPAVTEGRLVRVLEGFEPVPEPVSLLYSDARMMSPSLRVLLDYIRDRLPDALV